MVHFPFAFSASSLGFLRKCISGTQLEYGQLNLPVDPVSGYRPDVASSAAVDPAVAGSRETTSVRSTVEFPCDSFPERSSLFSFFTSLSSSGIFESQTSLVLLEARVSRAPF